MNLDCNSLASRWYRITRWGIIVRGRTSPEVYDLHRSFRGGFRVACRLSPEAEQDALRQVMLLDLKDPACDHTGLKAEPEERG